MKIVGLMVIGPGEARRYLRRSLDEFKRLCDDAIVCLNTEGAEERAMVNEFGYWNYVDLREWGVHQPNIKTDLYARVAKLCPDWVLPIDADEHFDSTLTRGGLEELTTKGDAWYFYVTNLWNDIGHYARGLSFWNIRFFKHIPENGVQYLKKALHCGLAPPWAYRLGKHAPHLLVHYGLMAQEDRDRKVERYNKYDPKAKHKSRQYYDALKVKSSGTEYQEEAVLSKVRSEVSKY